MNIRRQNLWDKAAYGNSSPVIFTENSPKNLTLPHKKTNIGAVLGTSTTTTFVENSSGVAEGGRTGLSSVVTGFLFLISLFLASVFTIIPSFATAPALILVGFLMSRPSARTAGGFFSAFYHVFKLEKL